MKSDRKPVMDNNLLVLVVYVKIKLMFLIKDRNLDNHKFLELLYGIY